MSNNDTINNLKALMASIANDDTAFDCPYEIPGPIPPTRIGFIMGHGGGMVADNCRVTLYDIAKPGGKPHWHIEIAHYGSGGKIHIDTAFLECRTAGSHLTCLQCGHDDSPKDIPL